MSDWNPTTVRHQIGDDLTAIAEMYVKLRAEAVNRAGDPDIPGGAAMVALGPGADVEAWGWHRIAAAQGRLRYDATETARILAEDIEPPLSFLAGWADIVREERGGEPSQRLAEVGREIKYLRSALDWMLSAQDDGTPWWLPIEEFAFGLHQVRARLEAILAEGDAVEYGMPCLHCDGVLLEREHHLNRGRLDSYRCPRCRRRYEKASYDYVVGVSYLHNSPTLTAEQIERREGISATRIRVWGSRYDGLKKGKNPDGLFVYDVDAVLAKRDELEGIDVA